MWANSGFKVTRMFHPTAIVDDLWLLRDFYGAVFGANSLTIPYVPGAYRWASFTLIGDMWIENMSPDPAYSTPHWMLLYTFGPHWAFPAFYVEDMQDCIYQMHHRHGIRLTAAGTGLPVTGSLSGPAQAVAVPSMSGPSPSPVPQVAVIFTNPQDTGMIFEFVEYGPEFPTSGRDPRLDPGWRLEPPGEDDPIGVEFGSHHTILAEDPRVAIDFLVDVCKGTVLHEGVNEALGTESIWLTVGEDASILEFANPIEAGAAKRDLEQHNSRTIYHALTFKVQALDRTASHLARQGIGIESRNDGFLMTDPSDCCGLRFGFCEELAPGHPRLQE